MLSWAIWKLLMALSRVVSVHWHISARGGEERTECEKVKRISIDNSFTKFLRSQGWRQSNRWKYMKWQMNRFFKKREMLACVCMCLCACIYTYIWIFMYMAFQVGQWQRICLPMQEKQETSVWSLGQEDPLEQEMATHPSILAWEVPRIEEPCGLQSMGLHRVRHDLVTKQQQQQAVLCGLWDLTSLRYPTRDWTPGPWQWKCYILITGWPRTSWC